MIHKFNCLADAYSSGKKGNIGVNIDGTAYIDTDDRPIEYICACKWKEIEEIREYKYGNGVFVDGHWWQTSIMAKIRYMGAASLGFAFPGVGWKTMNGDVVGLTGSLASKIMIAVANQDGLIFKVAQDHKRDMEASEDPCEYDINIGWPETFGEYIET